MPSGHIQLTQDGVVGTVALDRPEKSNAYTTAMLNDLAEMLAQLAQDDAVRVVVVTSSTPGIFCAGADLSEMKRRTAHDATPLRSLEVFDVLAALPKATIAVIDGPAVGGGVELALACDFRLASSRAWFRLPEVQRGIIPAAGATFRLPRIAGETMARQMILFADKILPTSALASGLVSEATDPESLGPRVEHWCQCAAAADPLALALAKRAIAASEGETGRAVAQCSQAALYQVLAGRAP